MEETGKKNAVIEFKHFSFQYFSQAGPTLHEQPIRRRIGIKYGAWRVKTA